MTHQMTNNATNKLTTTNNTTDKMTNIYNDKNNYLPFFSVRLAKFLLTIGIQYGTQTTGIPFAGNHDLSFDPAPRRTKEGPRKQAVPGP